MSGYEKTNSITVDKPDIAGASDTVYSDNDGEVQQEVTALAITSKVVGDIGDGTSINITLSDANIAFDQSQEPDVAVVDGGITDVSVTKFTETEIGMVVTGDSNGIVVITIGGSDALRVNVSAAAPDTEVVNFTVKTTPADGSLVSQVYDALDIVYEYPGVAQITFTTALVADIAGTTVPVVVHAASTNIPNYGGCVINFTITAAPVPYGSYANASWNITGDWIAQLTTGSDGDTPVIGLVLSTRSSDVEDGNQDNAIAVEASGAPASVAPSTAASQDDVETQISVDADKERAESTGADTITLTAKLRDQYMNNVAAGDNATAAMGVSTDSDTAIATPGDAAFLAGVQTILLTDTVAEDVTVTVTTPVEGISPGLKMVSFFNYLIEISEGWALISIPERATVINVIEADIEAGLSHNKSDGWLTTREAHMIEFGNPVSAIYLKANKTTTIGFIWTDVASAFYTKELGSGWNLIGVSLDDTADILLAQLDYSLYGTNEGMVMMYNPPYNSNKVPAGVAWEQLMYATKNSIPVKDLGQYDGYWIYMGSADGELLGKNYFTLVS